MSSILLVTVSFVYRGWRTNSCVLESQTSALRHAFGSSADFVYVNAPWTASGPVPDVVRLSFGDSGPFYQWWDARTHSSDSHSHYSSSSSAPPQSRSYHGFQRSLDHLTRQLDALEPVDVVLGFSQGAAMATLLTAHYLSRSPSSPSSSMSSESLVPYKVCVLVAGFDPETPETLEMLLEGAWASVEGTTLDVPSVHVVRTADTVVTALASQKLEQRFPSNGRVRFEHDGGHEFPSRVKWRQLYRDIAEHVLSITGRAQT